MYDGGGYETEDDPRDRRAESGRRRNLLHDLLPENRFVAILVVGAVVMIFIVLFVHR
jgi:hypothetical protein